MQPERARARRPLSAARLGAALLSTAPLILIGCGVHGAGTGYGGPPVFNETEPNGNSDHPDFFGGVDGFSHFVIEGSVDAFGPDWLDGFAFVAEEPITFSFELHASSGFADIDAFLYDPVLGQTIAWFDSEWNPEVGSFSILEPGKEFHLVIETYDADTSYSLEIWADPAFFSESGGPELQAAGSFGLTPNVRAPRKARREDAVYGAPRRSALEDEVRVLGHGFVLAMDGDGAVVQSLDFLLTADGRAIAVPTHRR